jgi:SET and MYND domain-containing protein
MKETITKEVPKAVQATMEILIRRKHGLIPDQQWQMLRSLDTHVDDFKRNGNYDGIQLMALGCRNYSMTQDMFSTEFVEGMYARVSALSLTLNIRHLLIWSVGSHKLADTGYPYL